MVLNIKLKCPIDFPRVGLKETKQLGANEALEFWCKQLNNHDEKSWEIWWAISLNCQFLKGTWIIMYLIATIQKETYMWISTGR